MSRATARPHTGEPLPPLRLVEILLGVVLGGLALACYAIADLSTLARRIARRLTR